MHTFIRQRCSSLLPPPDIDRIARFLESSRKCPLQQNTLSLVARFALSLLFNYKRTFPIHSARHTHDAFRVVSLAHDEANNTVLIRALGIHG